MVYGVVPTISVSTSVGGSAPEDPNWGPRGTASVDPGNHVKCHLVHSVCANPASSHDESLDRSELQQRARRDQRRADKFRTVPT